VTDANSCTYVVSPLTMTEPPGNTIWTLSGNIGTNPANQYIGTADNTDFVFRTNATERLRIKGNGDVTLGGPFTAASDAHVLGDLSVNTISFANSNVTIGYAALANLPPTVSYGGAPNSFVYSVDECVTPHLTGALNHQFYGGIQLYGYNSSNWLNVMQVGFDGANAIIDATGNSTDPYSNRLLLNYYCGRDVFVGNTTSGDLTANRNFYALGKVGIGTSSPVTSLQIGNAFTIQEVLGVAPSIARNVYFDESASSEKRIVASGGACKIQLEQVGGISFRTTGTNPGAGSAINDWKTPLYLTEDGKARIGGDITDPIYEQLQIGDEFLFHNGVTKAIRRNVYYANGSNWRIYNQPAVSVNMNILGDFSVSTALTGAAGSEITAGDWIDGLIVKNNGNIGIGTGSPLAFDNTIPSFNPVIMHLRGQSPVIRLEDTEVNRPSGYIPTNMAIESANGSGRIICDKGVAVFINANGEDSSPNSVNNSFCVLSKHSAFESPVEELFRVNKDGRAFALSMQVTLSGFSDFVFNDDYKLPSLADVETYIKTNKHLPNVPTSAEIVKDGLDIGEMLKLQMQKIEELTLYMIELKKENDLLKAEVEKLK
jgi:hypothetical protein